MFPKKYFLTRQWLSLSQSPPHNPHGSESVQHEPWPAPPWHSWQWIPISKFTKSTCPYLHLAHRVLTWATSIVSPIVIVEKDTVLICAPIRVTPTPSSVAHTASISPLPRSLRSLISSSDPEAASSYPYQPRLIFEAVHFGKITSKISAIVLGRSPWFAGGDNPVTLTIVSIPGVRCRVW